MWEVIKLFNVAELQNLRSVLNMNKLEVHQKKQFSQLINAIGPDIELSDAEIRSLMWLAGYEASTVENIASVIKKVSKNKD